MRKEEYLLILLGALLLLAMLLTLFFGGERSRHGYGSLDPPGLVDRRQFLSRAEPIRTPTSDRWSGSDDDQRRRPFTTG